MNDTEMDLSAPVQAVLSLLAYRARRPSVRRGVSVDPRRLTAREVQVLRLLAEGNTAQAMARKLEIAPATVRKHLERVYAKLGAHDRLLAVLRAQELGLLDHEGMAAREAGPAEAWR